MRRGPLRKANVGKSFGSRRFPDDDVEWWKVDGDGGVWAAERATADEDGDTPLDVDVIDSVEDSFSDDVRPPLALLGEVGCDDDEVVLSDFDRSCRR